MLFNKEKLSFRRRCIQLTGEVKVHFQDKNRCTQKQKPPPPHSLSELPSGLLAQSTDNDSFLSCSSFPAHQAGLGTWECQGSCKINASLQAKQSESSYLFIWVTLHTFLNALEAHHYRFTGALAGDISCIFKPLLLTTVYKTLFKCLQAPPHFPLPFPVWALELALLVCHCRVAHEAIYLWQYFSLSVQGKELPAQTLAEIPTEMRPHEHPSASLCGTDSAYIPACPVAPSGA